MVKPDIILISIEPSRWLEHLFSQMFHLFLDCLHPFNSLCSKFGQIPGDFFSILLWSGVGDWVMTTSSVSHLYHCYFSNIRTWSNVFFSHFTSDGHLFCWYLTLVQLSGLKRKEVACGIILPILPRYARVIILN